MASLTSNLAPAYNSSTSYKSGDKVMKDGHLYLCKKTTTGIFDSSCWEEIYLSDLMSHLGEAGKNNPRLLGYSKWIYVSTSYGERQIDTMSVNDGLFTQKINNSTGTQTYNDIMTWNYGGFTPLCDNFYYRVDGNTDYTLCPKNIKVNHGNVSFMFYVN